MRKTVYKETRDKAIDEVIDNLLYRLREKGNGEFVSILEIRGSLDEEFREVQDAMHEKNIHNIKNELKDIAVSAIWGLASIKNWQCRNEKVS